jgi:EAL domain-containing protein (putative c-di-GMP-specific phosphodiesterase class I)
MFMPAAERFSLTNALDKWVIVNTLDNIAAMNIDDDKNTGWQFGINLSAQSINTHEMIGFIISAFEKTGVNPGLIRFEVKESMAISHLATARRFITLLKGLGCQFALDDFGKGLSSFTYLKHIPVDAIKIDGAFVRDIVDDKISSAFIDAINQIAHVMGIETIAEYVENETIYNAILKTRVDFVQGHYIAQPQPLSSFI